MKHYIFPLLLAILITAGCSGKVPLGGTVTFSDDGAPVPTGLVYFTTESLTAQGAINADGKYVVGTDRVNDGLPRGTYQVYIVGADDIAVRQMRPLGQTDPVTGQNIDDRYQETVRTPLIDTKYARPETSGLTFTVDGRTRTFDIQVDRAR